jgi:hypothetical protein
MTSSTTARSSIVHAPPPGGAVISATTSDRFGGTFSGLNMCGNEMRWVTIDGSGM